MNGAGILRLLAMGAVILPTFADEGMWTFDNPPQPRSFKRSIISRPPGSGSTTFASRASASMTEDPVRSSARMACC